MSFPYVNHKTQTGVVNSSSGRRAAFPLLEIISVLIFLSDGKQPKKYLVPQMA